MISKRLLSSTILAAATMFAVPRPLFAQTPAADAAVEAALKDLQQQEAVLLDPSATLQQRDQAAQRLVSRNSADADAILERMLTVAGTRDARLAVAKALINDPTPNDDFILRLASLLGSDRDLTAAAAQALATYKRNELARDKLIQFASNAEKPVLSRVAAVRAMGKLVDRLAAGFLIDRLADRGEAAQVRSSAADALAEMTGLTMLGQDAQRWANWWRDNRLKNDLEWSTDLLNRNAVRAAELEKRLEGARRQIQKMIRAEYDQADSADRGKILTRYLQSDLEDVRLETVKIVQDDVANGKLVPAGILLSLRGMVGDSSAEVRGWVAQTLSTANDAEAVDVLLAQLAQEHDLDVLRHIISALGRTHDLRVVEPLMAALDNESLIIARAAADSFKELAAVLRDEKNATIATQIAQRLVQTMRRVVTAGDTAAADFRGSLADAMGRLGHPSMLNTFYVLINPERGSQRERIAGYRGLGLIGNRDSASNIVSALQSEKAPGVRLAGVEALGRTAGGFEFASFLERLLTPDRESDPDVRLAAWEVLLKLCDTASAPELLAWTRRAKDTLLADPQRWHAVQSRLETKYAAAGRKAELARTRLNLGEALLQMDKPDDAAAKFRQALDYLVASNAGPSEIDVPMQRLEEALLRAGKYADAAAFATQMIKLNSANTDVMWRQVKGEIDRLRRANKFDSAIQLIEEARKVPLGDSYTAGLLPKLKAEVEEDKKKQGANSRTWVRQANPSEQAALDRLTKC